MLPQSIAIFLRNLRLRSFQNRRYFVTSKIFFYFLLWGLAVGLPVEAAGKKLPVKIKLMKCSLTSGGVYREGPAVQPTCAPLAGRFLILGKCQNKYDPTTCKIVRKRKSPTGIYETTLLAGKYHFVWDFAGKAQESAGSCSLQISEAYDVKIKEPHQEIALTLHEHCSVP